MLRFSRAASGTPELFDLLLDQGQKFLPLAFYDSAVTILKSSSKSAHPALAWLSATP